MPSSSSSVASASSSIDLREREADVDQDPVADRDAARLSVEQGDVDVAADARHIDLREPVLLVDHLENLTRYRQAHPGPLFVGNSYRP